MSWREDLAHVAASKGDEVFSKRTKVYAAERRVKAYIEKLEAAAPEAKERCDHKPGTHDDYWHGEECTL